MNMNRVRQAFLNLNIRTKIILGILVTGGLTLGIFTLIVASQTEKVTILLSTRLEKSVNQKAEEQLKNTVSEQAILGR